MATRGIVSTLLEKTTRYRENQKTHATNATKISVIPGSLSFVFSPLAQFLAKSVTFAHSIFPPIGATFAWLGVFMNLVGFCNCLWRKFSEGRFNLKALSEVGDAFLDLFASLGSALLLSAVAILPYILAGALAGTLGPILLIGAAAFTAAISFGRSLWHMTQTLKYLILKDKAQMTEHLGKALDYSVYTVGAALMALALATMMVALPHITLPLFLTFSAAAAVAVSLLMCAYSAAKTLYGVLTTNIDEKNTSVAAKENSERSLTPQFNFSFLKQKDLFSSAESKIIPQWFRESRIGVYISSIFSNPTPKPVSQNKRLDDSLQFSQNKLFK